jgi:lauroyl/myristoyl acyltransferase
MVLMGMHDLPVTVVNTVMIEDASIHPAVRHFFQTKYRAMENRMNGRMPYYQTEMPYFYKVLEKGEIVVLMGDIPGSRSDYWINWLGRPFRMPLGAWHMAKKTNSLITSFVCVHEGIGRYRVIMMPLREIDPDSPERTLVPLYEFMENCIRQYPERWISADLLPGYGAQLS